MTTIYIGKNAFFFETTRIQELDPTEWAQLNPAASMMGMGESPLNPMGAFQDKKVAVPDRRVYPELDGLLAALGRELGNETSEEAKLERDVKPHGISPASPMSLYGGYGGPGSALGCCPERLDITRLQSGFAVQHTTPFDRKTLKEVGKKVEEKGGKESWVGSVLGMFAGMRGGFGGGSHEVHGFMSADQVISFVEKVCREAQDEQKTDEE